MSSAVRAGLYVALVAALDADPDNPDRPFDVVRHARDGIVPARPTVMLAVDSHTPHPAAPRSHAVASCRLVLVVPYTADEIADDELDDALQDLVYAIDESPDLPHWRSAERATYGDTLPAYEITVQQLYRKDAP